MVKVKKWSRRVVWMVAIWCASVLLLAGVGMLFRLLMTSAGFSLLTDTPRTRFHLSRKRVFIDRSAFIDHLCSPYLSPQ